MLRKGLPACQEKFEAKDGAGEAYLGVIFLRSHKRFSTEIALWQAW